MAIQDFNERKYSKNRSGVPFSNQSNAGEKYYAYEQKLCQLLQEYMEELTFARDWSDKLRRERITLLSDDIPNIQKKLIGNDISEKTVAEWINDMKSHVEHSISVCEGLLEDFIKPIDELKKELKRKIYEETNV